MCLIGNVASAGKKVAVLDYRRSRSNSALTDKVGYTVYKVGLSQVSFVVFSRVSFGIFLIAIFLPSSFSLSVTKCWLAYYFSRVFM